MPISAIPEFLQDNYEVHEWRHATAILSNDFPEEWADIVSVFTSFHLYRSDITKPGGRKSDVPTALDQEFVARG